MADSRTQCQFKLSFDRDYQCPHPVESSGLCIFHLLSEEPIDTTIEEKFRQKFIGLLESKERDPEIQACDFRGFCFPLINLAKRTFPKAVSFRDSTFKAKADFRDSIFKAAADFRGSTFEAEVDFRNSTFEARADFWNSTFKAEAYFWHSTFVAKALFGNSTFEAEADFRNSTFKAETYFRNSTFVAEVHFGNSTFEAEANFGGSTFKAEAYFAGGSNFLSECEFIALGLKKDAQIIFEKANLTKASFLDTNLESINFRDVYWYVPKKKLIPRKKALWDEFRPLKNNEKGPRDYEKIAENYRQLVLNYERKRDYETAEQFHVGEMEARRKKKAVRIGRPVSVWKRKLWEHFNAYYLYRLLNNYGTSYWHGFVVLLLMLSVFSAIFLCTGFKRSPQTPGSVSQVIEYDVCWPNSKHYQDAFRQWLPDYCEAILFTLSIITFQRKDYQPVGAWSKFWLYIAIFVLTSQAALVLLAIRRQFRR